MQLTMLIIMLVCIIGVPIVIGLFGFMVWMIIHNVYTRKQIKEYKNEKRKSRR